MEVDTGKIRKLQDEEFCYKLLEDYYIEAYMNNKYNNTNKIVDINSLSHDVIQENNFNEKEIIKMALLQYVNTEFIPNYNHYDQKTKQKIKQCISIITKVKSKNDIPIVAEELESVIN